MENYENAQHENEILRLLARGEKEIEAGTGYELDEVMKEAGRTQINPPDGFQPLMPLFGDTTL